MKSRKNMIISLIIICYLLFTLIGTAQSDLEIIDIPTSNSAYQSIKLLVDKNILSLDNNKFSPNSFVNRGQFAMYLTKALDLPIVLGTPTYQDVKNNSPYFPYVQASLEYIPGFTTEKGVTFNLTKRILKEDLVVALVKGKGFDLKSAGTTLLNKYNDKKNISKGLESYYALAEKHGLLLSLELAEDSHLNPQSEANKRLIALVLADLIDNEQEQEDLGKFVWASTENNLLRTLRTPKLKTWTENGDLHLQWTPTTNEDFLCYHIQLHSEFGSKIDNFSFQYPTNNLTTIANSAVSSWVFPNVKDNRYYKIQVVSVYKDQTLFSNTVKILVPDPDSKLY